MSEIKKFDNSKNSLLKNSIENNQGKYRGIGLSGFNIPDIADDVVTEVLDEIENPTVSDEYITENFDYEYYQEQLEKVLSEADTDREKAVAAAMFLATRFPKLPYFWGGGHELSVEELKGINKSWGSIQAIEFGLDDDYLVGEYYPYSYDCSGFVSWCLVNAGYSLPDSTCLNTGTCSDLGEHVSITDANVLDKVNIGDLGLMKGHVGIIVDINEETNEITFAHISGTNYAYGMGLTTISTETGTITKEDVGVMPEKDKYGNSVEFNSHIGTEYFKEIVLVPYKD